MIDLLKQGLLQLGIESSPEREEKVVLYTKELIDWSKKINLTAIKVPDDIIVKHFLDSLVCLKEIEGKAVKLLDIGTGAGFPGLPLKIFSPNLSVSMMEATGKKVRFLHELLIKLNIEDVVLLHGRAEELSKKENLRGKFDVIVIRAVGELKLLAKLSFPFLKKGGCLLALKGFIIDEEVKRSQKVLDKMGGTIEKILDYELISGKKGKLVKIVKGIYEKNSTE
ncbi:MAG: 16S rRNA (guanine(527)-N(7))-methyltransferase RsmG [bacterium]